jgi:hypothetical protein
MSPRQEQLDGLSHAVEKYTEHDACCQVPVGAAT